MPALSIKARRAWAIAEHEPSKLHKANRGMLKVSRKVQHEFADTPEKGLPVKKKRAPKS
jgi:hypothetical protein